MKRILLIASIGLMLSCSADDISECVTGQDAAAADTRTSESSGATVTTGSAATLTLTADDEWADTIKVNF